jgi:AraC-like DNA-binding protein
METGLLFTTILLSMLAGVVVGKFFFAKKPVKSEDQPVSAINTPEPIPTGGGEDQHDMEDVELDEYLLTKKIFSVFVEEKVFRIHGLTVGQFAERLGVKQRVVTQVLEKLSGHSFKELINIYRIKYAVEKIEEGYLDKYTLDALGRDAGFSSRITFFNVFKREVGICPKEYRKQYENMAA